MPDNVYAQSRVGVQDVTVTVTSGQNLSSAAYLNGRSLKRVLTPVGTQGGYLVFWMATSVGGTFTRMRDKTNVVISVPFTAGEGVELDATLFAGTLAVKIQTASSSDGLTAQTQSADRALELVAVSV